MYLRSNGGSEGTVGGRQVQQTLQLQTEGQGREQQTYAIDQCEDSGGQVLRTEVQAHASRHVHRTVQTPRL